MKDLSTKEFAVECVNALVGVRNGIRCLKWGIKNGDELELDSVLNYLDLLNEEDSAHWVECSKRFGGSTPGVQRAINLGLKGTDGRPIKEHYTFESFDEFRSAFLDAAKEAVNNATH